ncbi:hypothetical protein BaRGS_00022512 [Batillaria attramentaria]|uniref:Uncharacterized protein n=1 Tax=Batillaria attramentaria TaxID=370345 RepID=A0ABD0KGF6_9CAEN
MPCGRQWCGGVQVVHRSNTTTGSSAAEFDACHLPKKVAGIDDKMTGTKGSQLLSRTKPAVRTLACVAPCRQFWRQNHQRGCCCFVMYGHVYASLCHPDKESTVGAADWLAEVTYNSINPVIGK